MYTNVTHRIILYFNKVLLLVVPLLNEHTCYNYKFFRKFFKSNKKIVICLTLTHVILHQACLKIRINYNLLSDTVLKTEDKPRSRLCVLVSSDKNAVSVRRTSRLSVVL